MGRRGLAVLIMVAVVHTAAGAQDYRKVIDIVQRMEERLTKMLAEEERARKAAVNQLRSELSATQPGSVQTGATASHEPGGHAVSNDPVARLLDGNRRFVEGRTAARDFVHERPALTAGQHPYAIILTCSDSRVPPELLFDESLGQLFVVRDAGNVVDPVVLGSIEYAAEHLHAGLLVVLGHEACGAVNATIKGGEVPPNIGQIVQRISPPVEKVKAQHLKGVRIDSVCIHENVRYQVAQVTGQSALLKSMVDEGHLRILGATYSLTTGGVTFLEGASSGTHAGASHAAPAPVPATAEKRKQEH
ncbi:partial Carbonic anhydrase 2 [Anaerolineae bacterium]|nr:partial Carbonic anhydrase 2 [Anaerolineae bacterium]